MNQEEPSDYASASNFVREMSPRIEEALHLHLPSARTPGGVAFREAMHYAVFPGGRRVRAMLALLSSELVQASEEHALAAAVVVEYLHSSALILDDLPGMDDARERRGRACLHLRYGEGLAIVVALTLMNASYEIVALGLRPETIALVPALRELTDCIAAQIAGQAIDISCTSAGGSDQQDCDEPARYLKTSALIRLALTLGPTLSGAPASEVASLSRFGELLGYAYQHIDDACDIEEDRRLLHRGRDASFAMLHGEERARQRANVLIAEAQRCLRSTFGDRPAASRLCGFAASVLPAFDPL